MKSLENINRIQLTNETMLSLLSLYESKGKSFYYDDLFQRDRQAFEKKSLATSLLALCSYFNLDVTIPRVKLLAKKEMVAKNKEEQLLINIKNVLTILHEKPAEFELLINEIADLLKLLSRNCDPIAFRAGEKEPLTILGKTKTRHKKDELERLIELYLSHAKTGRHELTQLISNFYVDFLNMDLLTDQNELVGIIILYALLLSQFNVFKYASFFKYLLKEKDAWQQGVITASYYWQSGFAQTDLVSRTLINILLDCYKEVDDLAHEFSFEVDLNKSDTIENSILKIDEIFSKEDLRKRHPNVSDATIDRTLKRLKEEEKIRPLGKGRSSKWQRIIPGYKKFGSKQLTLFDD